jgi:hypothetical protein
MMLDLLRRLRRDRRGLALVEFAYFVPILITMSITGAEFVHYITVKMKISQIALHVADNAARIGEGTVLTARRVSEGDINDVLTGAGMQAAELDLYGRGRVILSDLEPVANPNPTNRYRIGWQRCRGAKTQYLSSYGREGQTNMTGMGPAGRQVIAMPNNATMFVQVFYEYQPLVMQRLAPSMTMMDIGSMAVRERRDLSQIFPTTGVTPSMCGG